MLEPVPTLREWLREGPFALAMSSGFFGFFAHAGVVSVLEAEGLLPTEATGSSAGALVTGLWSAGVGAATLRQELSRLTRADFWDPGVGLGLLRGHAFRAQLRRMIPYDDFASTRMKQYVSVFDPLARCTRVLCKGQLSRAISASCAVPGLFHPVRIDGRSYLDGGVLDRPGIAGIGDGTRCLYHHLASKSPWRAMAPTIPKRSNLVAVVLPDLPRSGPFRLDAGVQAMGEAEGRFARALDARVHLCPIVA